MNSGNDCGLIFMKISFVLELFWICYTQRVAIKCKNSKSQFNASMIKSFSLLHPNYGISRRGRVRWQMPFLPKQFLRKDYQKHLQLNYGWQNMSPPPCCWFLSRGCRLPRRPPPVALAIWPAMLSTVDLHAVAPFGYMAIHFATGWWNCICCKKHSSFSVWCGVQIRPQS